MKRKSVFLQILILFLILFLVNACADEKVLTAYNSPAKNSEENRSNIENKVLSLCEIEKNRAEFDGKTVRLKTLMAFGVENDVISNEGCVHNAVVTFKSDEAYNQIKKIREESSRKKVTLFYADVEIEGIFINKPFTQCCTETPFQFEITKTFAASPIKRN